jgi:hypothetical protein
MNGIFLALDTMDIEPLFVTIGLMFFAVRWISPGKGGVE